MSNVSDILKVKGNAVWTVQPEDTAKDTLKLMADKNSGAVLVVDGKKLVGIFSERDFARHSAIHSLKLEEAIIKDMMTSIVISVSPDQTTEECMAIMTSRHIRHLPVIEHDELVGVISIGDVVKRIIEDHKFSINQLKDYVAGGM